MPERQSRAAVEHAQVSKINDAFSISSTVHVSAKSNMAQVTPLVEVLGGSWAFMGGKAERFALLRDVSHSVFTPFLVEASIKVSDWGDSTTLRLQFRESVKAVGLPPLDPRNKTKSTLSARRNANKAINIVLGSVNTRAVVESAVANPQNELTEEDIDGETLKMVPEYKVATDAVGGQNEGSVLIGMLFASILESYKGELPFPDAVAEELEGNKEALKSLMRLHLVPQKVIDTMAAEGINPFEKRDTGNGTEVITLSIETVQFLESLSQFVFTNETLSPFPADSLPVFSVVARCIPRSFFPAANGVPDSILLSQYDTLYTQTENEREKNGGLRTEAQLLALFVALREVKEEMEKTGTEEELGFQAKFRLIVGIMLQLASYRDDVDNNALATCPAHKAGIFPKWFDFWSTILTQWYEKEYTRISTGEST